MKYIKNLIIKIALIISFIIPISILYYLEPTSFEKAWRGRIFHLFFIWLATLETILDWEKLQVSFVAGKSFKRAFVFLLVSSAPTIYVIMFNCYGYNEKIIKIATENRIALWIAEELPVPVEFLVFTVLFSLAVLLAYGIESLPVFSGSIFFLGIMGILFMIDDLYPGGRFTPLQILVPVTAFFSAFFLELLGYRTAISSYNDPIYGNISTLEVNGQTLFKIGWICAGVESLIIYTIVIFLFLKKSEISTRRKLIYFAIGAVITYFINIMRIFTLAMIALHWGDIEPFHNFYGQFYSITWITLYPLMIVGVEKILKKG
jgi:thaumarchaeosortase